MCFKWNREADAVFLFVRQPKKKTHLRMFGQWFCVCVWFAKKNRHLHYHRLKEIDIYLTALTEPIWMINMESFWMMVWLKMRSYDPIQMRRVMQKWDKNPLHKKCKEKGYEKKTLNKPLYIIVCWTFSAITTETIRFSL